MTASFGTGERAPQVFVPASPPDAGTHRAMMVLLSLGMLASLVALLSFREAVRTQMGAGQFYTHNASKSSLYYAAQAGQIALLTGAGAIGLITISFRAFQAGYLWRVLAYFAAGLLMTVRGYALPELLSTKLFDAWGPVPIILSSLAFVAARQSSWAVLNKFFNALGIVFSILTLLFIAQLQSLTRAEAVASLTSILNVLFWPASWIALRAYATSDTWRRFRFVPLSIYAAGSLFVQTRLNIVMIAAALAAYVYLQGQRRALRAPAGIAALAGVLWCAGFSAIFLAETPVASRIGGVAESFWARTTEDTRTGQLVDFVKDVQPYELLLGRGAMATWTWGGIEWKGGTDVGYLTLLFFGGVPLLVTYIWMHLAPARVAFDAAAPDFQRVAGCIVLLWALRMFSSSYPSIGLDYYPVLLSVGICVARTGSDGVFRDVQTAGSGG